MRQAHLSKNRIFYPDKKSLLLNDAGPTGNIKADKSKSTEKIDVAIATIMTFDRAIRCGNSNFVSVYDERGILFI